MKKSLLCIFLLFFYAITAFAQYTIRPSTLSVQSIIRTAPNVINFSIYFKNTAGDSAIAYSGGQFHLDFNKTILNGGTGTLTIINSGLPSNVQSTNPTVYTTSTPGQLRAAPKAPPGALVGGFLVNAGDSVLVAKFSLSTSASSFLNWTSHNISWRKTPDANPVSKVSAYIWNSNQIISSNTNFFVYPTNSKELTVTALIEGFFDGTNLVSDTVAVELHVASSPYTLVDQDRVILNSSGNAYANFFSAVDATNYYIVVKHRNAVETWSKDPQQFTGGSLSYDFTTASNKAYSDGVSANLPMKQINSKWCFWSGEVTNNYFIEYDDLLQVYNFYLLALEDPGYYDEDVTGNEYVEYDDVVLVYNNYAVEIWSQNPLNEVLTARPIKVKEINNKLHIN